MLFFICNFDLFTCMLLCTTSIVLILFAFVLYHRNFFCHYLLQLDHEGHKFSCQSCGTLFSSKKRAEEHHLVEHSGIRFACTQCSKTFSSQRKQREHETAKHTDRRPHACTVCGANFARHSALSYHLQKRHDRSINVAGDIGEALARLNETSLQHKRDVETARIDSAVDGGSSTSSHSASAVQQSTDAVQQNAEAVQVPLTNYVEVTTPVFIIHSIPELIPMMATADVNPASQRSLSSQQELAGVLNMAADDAQTMFQSNAHSNTRPASIHSQFLSTIDPLSFLDHLDSPFATSTGHSATKVQDLSLSFFNRHRD